MPFVLDASVAVSWAFTDEIHAVATDALTRMASDRAIVPALWWFELRNTLIVGERRKRLTAVDTSSFLRDLERMGVAVDHSPHEASVLALARRHRLTVYDACYLELAQREAVPLATLDAQLARAARAEGAPLLEA